MKYSVSEIEPIELKQLAQMVIKTPSLICGSAQHGKSNLSKLICEEIHKVSNIKLRCFDSSLQYVFNSPMKYKITIKDPQLNIANIGGREVNLGYLEIPDNMIDELLDKKSICFDFSECFNLSFIQKTQKRIILRDMRRLIEEVKRNKGQIKNRVLYIIEEAQSVYSSNSLRSNSLSVIARSISVGANFGISVLCVTRRIAEIGTKLSEHIKTKCVTQLNQDNDLRKIKKLIDKEYISLLKTLGLGQFLVISPRGVNFLKTEKFEGHEPEELEVRWVKRKSIVRRFLEGIRKGIKKKFSRMIGK